MFLFLFQSPRVRYSRIPDCCLFFAPQLPLAFPLSGLNLDVAALFGFFLWKSRLGSK